MKKSRISVLAMLSSAFICAMTVLSSCANGFDSDETFTSLVTNSTLQSPELTSENISVKTDAVGNELIQVSWKHVSGASGYHCIINNVDDPTNPTVIYEGDVDGTSISFTKEADTSYEISVRTLGNTKYGNTDASDASVVSYTTMDPATSVPSGVDLVTYFKENLKQTSDEQIFELASGANYTLSQELDFGDKKVQLRGNKVRHSQITLTGNGVITTSTRLTLKFLNIDATAADQIGVIQCSTEPAASCTNPLNVGYKDRAYALAEDITLKSCYFRGVQGCLFYIGQNSWAVKGFNMDNCLVQLNNDGTRYNNGAVICTFSKENLYNGKSSTFSAIRNIDIKNCTFWNIQQNSKNMFIRLRTNVFSNIFDTAEGSCSIQNCTFSKTMTGGSGTVYFARFTPNDALYPVTFKNNVIYDCYRVSSLFQARNTLDVSDNYAQNVTTATYSNDSTYLTIGKVGISEVNNALDFSQTNGGVSFKASVPGGDPRWQN